MASWQGKSRGSKFGYRIFVWILKNFGVLPAYAVLRFVAAWYLFFSYSTSRQVIRFYRTKLGYSLPKSLLFLYKNYYRLGQSIIDKVVVMSGIPNRFTFNFDGEENLHHLASSEGGGILLSAHIGNWDIAGHLLKRVNTRIHIVLFDGEYQQIKEYLDGITGERAVNVIVIRNDLSHIYAINDALANNELVCMHADRYLTGNKTLETRFLGAPALFPMGPFLLAARFKVPVSFVFAAKETSRHYHFFASAPIRYDHLHRNLAMQQMLEDFSKAMEIKVKRYPELWFNYYDFWARETGPAILEASPNE